MSRMMLLVVVFALAFAFAEAATKACDSVGDLIFVLDESTSIYTESFTHLLDFVTKIVNAIFVDVEHTRVGVMTYATVPRVIYRLGQSQTNDAVRKAITSIKQSHGDTYTHQALIMLRETMLTSGPTRPPGSRKVAVVITDGESTDPYKTKDEAKRLQLLKDLTVIAIGVGTNVDYKEIEAIAGSHDRVFTVDDYRALDTIRDAVLTQYCEELPDPVPTDTPAPTPNPELPDPAPTDTPAPKPIPVGCSGKKPIDHIWSVSNQAGVEETKAALGLISSIVSEMVLGPDGVQVGLAPRPCVEEVEIRLNQFGAPGEFITHMELRQLMSGAQTDRAIEYIRTKALSPQNGARSNSMKYGILIIDNKSEDWSNTLQEATMAKRAQIRLVVIGVGKNVNAPKLRELTWSAEDYFHTDSYFTLTGLKYSIIDRICQCDCAE